MFGNGGKLVVSKGKWPRVRLAVVVTSTVLVVISIPFPVAALIPSIIRQVQPTAEFLSMVIAPNVWNWITPSCVYVVLNILILALGLQSGALTASNSDVHAGPSTEFVHTDAEVDVQQSPDFEIQIHTHNNSATITNMVVAGCGNGSKPDDLVKNINVIEGETEEKSAMKEVEHMQAKPSGGLYCKKSRCALLRRSTTGLSNLSRESTHFTPRLDSMRETVVFEICAEQGEVDDVAEEDPKVRRHEGSLSSEELYAKAESFIGNFYRELKMQRENSWQRLCAIYRQSC